MKMYLLGFLIQYRCLMDILLVAPHAHHLSQDDVLVYDDNSGYFKPRSIDYEYITSDNHPEFTLGDVTVSFGTYGDSTDKSTVQCAVTARNRYVGKRGATVIIEIYDCKDLSKPIVTFVDKQLQSGSYNTAEYEFDTPEAGTKIRICAKIF